jgi:hypothetical protein
VSKWNEIQKLHAEEQAWKQHEAAKKEATNEEARKRKAMTQEVTDVEEFEEMDYDEL